VAPGGRAPERFAAVAPDLRRRLWAYGFPERAADLRGLPVWAFTACDDVVPVQETAKLVAVLQAAGGDVRITVYPDKNHDSWTETYASPELYEWLLSHHR
jgi:predicted peptidase